MPQTKCKGTFKVPWHFHQFEAYNCQQSVNNLCCVYSITTLLPALLQLLALLYNLYTAIPIIYEYTIHYDVMVGRDMRNKPFSLI